MKSVPEHIRKLALKALETGKNLGSIEMANMIADRINAEDTYYLDKMK